MNRDTISRSGIALFDQKIVYTWLHLTGHNVNRKAKPMIMGKRKSFIVASIPLIVYSI